MIPNVAGAATLVPGPPHVGELVKLKAAARNWKFSLSVAWKPLNSEKSRLCTPGPRTFGRKRPTFPNVKFGVCEKSDCTKYSFNRSAICPLRAGFWPLSVARIPGLFSPVVLPPFEMAIGIPFWNVRMPFICQPPSRKSTAFGIRAHVRPVPADR